MASILTNEGEQLLLEVVLRGRAVPGTYQVGLTNTALVVTDNLAAAAASEPAIAFGYARVTMEQSAVGWVTSALDGGHWKLTGKDVTWVAAGGDITPFQKVFLTDGTGLIGFWDTVATSILDGTSWTFTPAIKETSV